MEIANLPKNRELALGRARQFAPFLNEAATSFPEIAERFLEEGAEASVASP